VIKIKQALDSCYYFGVSSDYFSTYNGL
jgi:hypothetical protein